MSTTEESLARMEQCLLRIEALLATPPKVRHRVKKRGPDYSAMIAEAREKDLDQEPVKRVVELWRELLPKNPQPILSIEYRMGIRDLIARFHSMEDPFDGVRGVFEHIAANPYWCGQTKHKRRLGLSEVIDNLAAVMEGTYK
jgi:hypothetical protein